LIDKNSITPEDTLLLIEALEEKGMDDSLFQRLHRFSHGATIAAHKAYLQKIHSYVPDSNNTKVHLQLVELLETWPNWGKSG